MNEFQVWAPNAQRVQAQLGGNLHEMRPLSEQPPGGGWWSANVPEALAGMDYSFVIDGGDSLPDPRSPWQPHGVHGPSRLLDHSLFHWTDRGWQPPPLSSAIIYELHIGTCTPEGTFDGAIARLDHLANLGITHVEIMPVQEFPGDWGWGYDGVDLYAPHHAYGGPPALKRLVNACHSKGLAVLLDVVYNHLGPDGNYLARFGPYFSEKYKTPWGPAVNLDGPGSYEVRRFLCDNALMWLRDYHIDGLRIDAVHAIYDASATHFLEQLAAEVKALEAQTGRHFRLIAESDLNDPRVVTAREAGGCGVDAQWSDDFHHALHAALTGERAGYYSDFRGLADLAKAMEQTFVFDGRFSTYRQRIHGRRPQGLPASRFLAYLQTHDQVGNRPKGERSSQLMSAGRLKIGAALVFCSAFVPMLFQGEEFGASTPFQFFTQHQDQRLAQAVAAGRHDEMRQFGWKPYDIPDPQDPETFRRSKLDWSEITREPHATLLEWHRQLIVLRRAIPALTDGRLDSVAAQFDEERRWFALRHGPVAVLCNLAKVNQAMPAPFDGVVLLASGLVRSRDAAYELAPDAVVILGGRRDRDVRAFLELRR
jgi:maltooligosyltrehalose trehalohydrolase